MPTPVSGSVTTSVTTDCARTGRTAAETMPKSGRTKASMVKICLEVCFIIVPMIGPLATNVRHKGTVEDLTTSYRRLPLPGEFNAQAPRPPHRPRGRYGGAGTCSLCPGLAVRNLFGRGPGQ